MGRVLPEYLSRWTTEKVRDEGVQVIGSTRITDARPGPRGQVLLKLSSGQEIAADHVVVAVGLEPSTDLAKASGLEVDDRIGGFKANAELEARSNLWVAAPVHVLVLTWDPTWATRRIGIVESHLQTVGVFARPTEPENEETVETTPVATTVSAKRDDLPRSPDNGEDYDKGVVFYLRDDGVVVGIVLWNIFNRMSVARKIINEHKAYEDFSDLAKLFDIYSDD
ncbi:hypothetical protein MTO96_008434 [Rhipicephalus appendiculatus]